MQQRLAPVERLRQRREAPLRRRAARGAGRPRAARGCPSCAVRMSRAAGPSARGWTKRSRTPPKPRPSAARQSASAVRAMDQREPPPRLEQGRAGLEPVRRARLRAGHARRPARDRARPARSRPRGRAGSSRPGRRSRARGPAAGQVDAVEKVGGDHAAGAGRSGRGSRGRARRGRDRARRGRAGRSARAARA